MTKLLAIAGVVGLLGVGTGWMAVGASNSTRPDCPGKIVCPLTGEQVCKDRCPVTAAHIPPTAAETAETLCGGACPAPSPDPKPNKPRGVGNTQNNVVAPAGPAALTRGCCR